jgi:hypothetical protein
MRRRTIPGDRLLDDFNGGELKLAQGNFCSVAFLKVATQMQLRE